MCIINPKDMDLYVNKYLVYEEIKSEVQLPDYTNPKTLKTRTIIVK